MLHVIDTPGNNRRAAQRDRPVVGVFRILWTFPGRTGSTATQTTITTTIVGSDRLQSLPDCYPSGLELSFARPYILREPGGVACAVPVDQPEASYSIEADHRH